MKIKDMFLDIFMAMCAAVSAVPMRLIRLRSMQRMPLTFAVLRMIGIFPIRNHYYEPLFDSTSLDKSNGPRDLPGINFAIDRQLELLNSFRADIVPDFNVPRTARKIDFNVENGNFESGDAEIWFHMIRHYKPRKILEVGSGHSTRVARMAIESISADDQSYRCNHVCIEPYEMPWLENLEVEVIRNKLENTDIHIIDELSSNDIFFIDSSHIIRPQGEVLLEFLQILPRLKTGVIVHVHDIFTPRDYPVEWLEKPLFWNEQYLLEAFLSHNNDWQVLLGVNMLKHLDYNLLKSVCPYLSPTREPGSFYMQRL